MISGLGEGGGGGGNSPKNKRESTNLENVRRNLILGTQGLEDLTNRGDQIGPCVPRICLIA